MDHARLLTTAVFAGIATARLVDTLKEAIPIVPPPVAKSTAASLIAAASGAALAEGSWRGRVLAALGAAGMAMLTHEFTSLVSVTTDRQKVIVLRAAGR